MGLSGLELHHVAVRMRSDSVEDTLTFYRDVLGLSPDPGARDVPDVPLYWMNCGDANQIHVFAVEGVSKYARSPARDPFTPHVAFGVPDIEIARAELERMEVGFWRVGAGVAQQIFLDDGNGNSIEIHQIGTCRCQAAGRRPSAGTPRG